MIFINHEEEIKLTTGLQIFYFNAKWMVFNQRFIYLLSNISNKYPCAPVVVVDTDQFKGTCSRFNIKKIPTIIITLNGREIKRMDDIFSSTKEFVTIFDDICSI